MKKAGKRGPGYLTLAWAALGLGAVLAISAIPFLPDRAPQADAELVIDSTAERFAAGPSLPDDAWQTAMLREDSRAMATGASPATPAPPATTQRPTMPEAVATETLAGGSKRITLGTSAPPRHQPQQADPPDPSAEKVARPAAEEIRIALLDEEETLASEAPIIRVDDLPGAIRDERGMRPPRQSPPPAPIGTLLRTSASGDLPRRAANGDMPATYYRRAFTDPEQRATISVLVSGLGLSSTLTQQAIDTLPPEMTLAFAPYSRDIESWTTRARMAGHELVLEIPMEDAGVPASSLGSAALQTRQTATQNLQRLEWILSRFRGYVAVTPYFGRDFASNETAVAPVARTLREAGLGLFAEPGTAALATQMADLPGAIVDRVLPPTISDPGAVLDQLTAAARPDRPVLVKVYASPGNLRALKDWAATLEGGDVVLAPASVTLR